MCELACCKGIRDCVCFCVGQYQLMSKYDTQACGPRADAVVHVFSEFSSGKIGASRGNLHRREENMSMQTELPSDTLTFLN